MAFDRPRGLLGIDFEPEPLAGLEVWYRPPTVAAFAAVIALGDYSPIDAVTIDAIRMMGPVSEQFAGLLVSWNYEQRGVPVPVTDFLSLDALFVLRVVKTWARVTVGLPQIAADVVELPDAIDEDAFDPGSIPIETLTAV